MHSTSPDLPLCLEAGNKTFICLKLASFNAISSWQERDETPHDLSFLHKPVASPLWANIALQSRG